jgi:hypothetical protein
MAQIGRGAAVMELSTGQTMTGQLAWLARLPRFGFFLGPFGPVFSGGWSAKALFYRIGFYLCT